MGNIALVTNNSFQPTEAQEENMSHRELLKMIGRENDLPEVTLLKEFEIEHIKYSISRYDENPDQFLLETTLSSTLFVDIVFLTSSIRGKKAIETKQGENLSPHDRLAIIEAIWWLENEYKKEA